MPPKILIVGFGNVDRQDDGVAWHAIRALMANFHRTVPENYAEGIFPTGENPDFVFGLQLTPELAETIAGFDRVCFIDAHTGVFPEDLKVLSLRSEFQRSPFTHHLTPESLLALTLQIYGKTVEGTLVSIRGYEFGFSQSLSPRTQTILQAAVVHVERWIKDYCS